MSYLQYPRAKMGYGWLPKLTDAIGSTKLKITLIYDFKREELVINDEVILTKLNHLNIPYQLIPSSQSISYLKSLEE